MDAVERFMVKVEHAGDECWLWTASRNPAGYGLFTYKGKGRLAHSVAYELFVGPIPAGLTIDHTCHNADESCAGGPTCQHRRCVNPAHLEAVTIQENIARGRGTWERRKTHCSNGHALPLSVNGRRRCPVCARAGRQRFRDARRTPCIQCGTPRIAARTFNKEYADVRDTGLCRPCFLASRSKAA